MAAVEAGTRIRGRLLSALEDGAYDLLPNPGYVRGYISSYARFLELDPLPLLAMYKAETGAGRFNELNLPQVGEAVKPVHEQHAVPVRSAIFIVIAIALLSLAVWGITRLVRSPEATPPEPSSLSEPTGTAGSGSSATHSGEATTPNLPAATQLQPFTLVVSVSADGASWVSVAVDGKSAYQGTMTGGQSERFEVTSSAKVRVGNPAAVTITRDGKTVTMPTAGGSPTVTLKAQALK